jgi:hypothetical protein
MATGEGLILFHVIKHQFGYWEGRAKRQAVENERASLFAPATAAVDRLDVIFADSRWFGPL